MNSKLDIAGNRKARKWSRREKIGRVLWALATPLFRLSPRPLWGWRRALLRAFGAHIDQDVHIYPTVRIAIPWNLQLGEGCAVGDYAILYALGKISVGKRSTISQYAHLCSGSHDLSRSDRPLTKSTITIEDDAWIAADAFVGPGVTVAKGAVVGARAVIMKDVGPGEVVIGNPARVLRKLQS
jgi:putative colanic acid biosynthesis acetyltransferase WcaF